MVEHRSEIIKLVEWSITSGTAVVGVPGAPASGAAAAATGGGSVILVIGEAAVVVV